MATIDFETRTAADVDLKKSGPWNYARHDTTEVLCLAYRLAGAARTQLWLPWWGPPTELFERIAKGENVNAHNAFFEKCIWVWQMTRKFGWPDVPELQWRCSAARASVLTLPRALGNAAKVMGLPVQKDSDGHAVMMRMCKPRKISARESKAGEVVQINLKTGKYETVPLDGRAIYHDEVEDYRRLVNYCGLDVDTEFEMELRLPELNAREQVIWFLDQRINTRGIRVDRSTCEAAVRISDELNTRLNRQCNNQTNGLITTTRQLQALKNWVECRYPAVAPLTKLDKEKIAWLLCQPDCPPDVAAVLKIRQEQGKVSAAKYQALLNGADRDDDRIRDLLMYCGASTGRWASRRAQVHNLPRDGFDFDRIEDVIGAIRSADVDFLAKVAGKPMAALSFSLRNCLIAAPDHRLMIIDYAAVEARGLAWLAGDIRKMNAFRAGNDMYVLAADDVRRLTGLNTGDAKEHRQLGKVCELALGYGGGVGAFQTMGSTYGVYVPDETADVIKKAWRDAHPEIVDLWHSLERAAINAVKHAGKAFNANMITYWYTKPYLICRLPSGRRLYYVRPRIDMVEKFGSRKPTLTYEGVDAYTRQWWRHDTYGGKLAENVTQALCRDFLVEGMINLENAGYPVVLHVHDEAVVEVPNGFGSLAEAERLMVAMPAWADGCPLAVAGFESERYRK